MPGEWGWGDSSEESGEEDDERAEHERGEHERGPRDSGTPFLPFSPPFPPFFAKSQAKRTTREGGGTREGLVTQVRPFFSLI